MRRRKTRRQSVPPPVAVVAPVPRAPVLVSVPLSPIEREIRAALSSDPVLLAGFDSMAVDRERLSGAKHEWRMRAEAWSRSAEALARLEKVAADARAEIVRAAEAMEARRA